jgi:hypothetical protein
VLSRGKNGECWRVASRWPFFLFLVVAVSLKVPVLSLPFFWDELLVYARPAFSLADHGMHLVLPGLHDPRLFFGHTPGFSFGLAVLFKVLGESSWVARTYALGFTACTLYFLFRLAEFLAGRSAGILAVALYFFVPLVFAHSTMVVAELGLTACTTGALWFFLRGRPAFFVAAGLLAVCMKETSAALFVPAVVLAPWEDWRRGLAFVIPVLALALFFVLEKATTGSFSNFPFTETLSLAPGAWLLRAVQYFREYVLHQARAAALMVPAALGIWVLFRREPAIRRFAVLLVAFVVCMDLGIAAFTAINIRYFLPLYPVFALLAAVGLTRFFFPWPALLFAGLAAFLWIPHYDGSNSEIGYGFEGNMEYVDVIRVQTRAVDYLERNFRGKRISATWPLTAMLGDSRFGYVREPMPVFDRGAAPENADVVIMAQNAVPLLWEKAERLRRRGFCPERRFEEKGKWVEIWTSAAACPATEFGASMGR